jgi:hypothetical protein
LYFPACTCISHEIDRQDKKKIKETERNKNRKKIEKKRIKKENKIKSKFEEAKQMKKETLYKK